MKNIDIRENSNLNHSSSSESLENQPNASKHKPKSKYISKFRCFSQLDARKRREFKHKLLTLFNENQKVINHCNKYSMHVSNIHISSGSADLNGNKIGIKNKPSYQEVLERSCRSKDINFMSDDSYTSFREINMLHDELASIHSIRVNRKNINEEQIPELKSNKHGSSIRVTFSKKMPLTADL